MKKKSKKIKKVLPKKKGSKTPARKKLASKKSAPKKKAKAEKPIRQAQGKPIGSVTHFFGHIKVAIVKFKKPVRVGVTIRIKGVTTDFSQKIVSMQFNHEPVKIAQKNKSIGIKVSKRVREGDLVFEAKK